MIKMNRVFALFGNIVYAPKLGTLYIHENSYLVCENGFCAGIFSELPQPFTGIHVEDCRNQLIIPGLVDLHIHAPQYAFRGMGMDWELIDWLNKQTFPEEAKYADLAYAEKAYTILTEDLRKSATTRACMFATRHRDATILLMELMERSGLVSYVGKVNMDREAPEPLCEKDAEASAFDSFAWLNAIDGKFKRTFPILTPRFIPSCSNKLLEELREVRRAYSLPIQSHLSENPGEIEWVKSLRPDSAFYGDAYDIYDLFGERNEYSAGAKTIMAHCVWSGDAEIERIKENGVYVAHCPASNMNLSSGIAPIRKYLDFGLNVGLGSDVAGGQSASMFRAMTDAIQVSKMYWRYLDDNKKPLTLEEAFYLATKGGGSFFGNVGSFEDGYEFDALVLDDSILPHPQELSVKQRLERAIYLSLDTCGIRKKYIRGTKCFDYLSDSKQV